MRGARLLQARHPAELGVTVGAPRQTVNRWRGVLESDGLDALRPMSEGGCPVPLVGEELSRLQVALLNGPTANGFGTPLCARKRVRPFTDR